MNVTWIVWINQRAKNPFWLCPRLLGLAERISFTDGLVRITINECLWRTIILCRYLETTHSCRMVKFRFWLEVLFIAWSGQIIREWMAFRRYLFPDHGRLRDGGTSFSAPRPSLNSKASFFSRLYPTRLFCGLFLFQWRICGRIYPLYSPRGTAGITPPGPWRPRVGMALLKLLRSLAMAVSTGLPRSFHFPIFFVGLRNHNAVVDVVSQGLSSSQGVV